MQFQLTWFEWRNLGFLQLRDVTEELERSGKRKSIHQGLWMFRVIWETMKLWDRCWGDLVPHVCLWLMCKMEGKWEQALRRSRKQQQPSTHDCITIHIWLLSGSWGTDGCEYKEKHAKTTWKHWGLYPLCPKPELSIHIRVLVKIEESLKETTVWFVPLYLHLRLCLWEGPCL